MALIDTHCHYNMEPLWHDWQKLWQAAQTKGVVASILAGADKLSCQRGLEIAQQTPRLLAAIGFHPEVYDLRVQELFENHQNSSEIIEKNQELLAEDIFWLKAQAKENQPIAIGETGLDYYYFKLDQADLNHLKVAVQQFAFRAQIKLANDLKLPLIVHTRDKAEAAYRDALSLIKQDYKFLRPFILHCVSGPLDYISEAISLGGYIGFDGNLTYKKNQNLVEIFKSVPADRILLETDAPFLPPTPHRGEVCEPWMVSLTAEYMEKDLGLSKEQLFANAVKCFDLNQSIMG